MSYESDYQYRQQTSAGRADRHPMDLPDSGGSSKGLLVFAIIIAAFIGFVVLVSLGSPPDGVVPGADGTVLPTVPEAGTGEVVPAPAQGE